MVIPVAAAVVCWGEVLTDTDLITMLFVCAYAVWVVCQCLVGRVRHVCVGIGGMLGGVITEDEGVFVVLVFKVPVDAKLGTEALDELVVAFLVLDLVFSPWVVLWVKPPGAAVGVVCE